MRSLKRIAHRLKVAGTILCGSREHVLDCEDLRTIFQIFKLEAHTYTTQELEELYSMAKDFSNFIFSTKRLYANYEETEVQNGKEEENVN